MKRTLYALLTLILATQASAETDHANCPMKKKGASEYSERAELAIKALRPADIEQYRKGTGMGLAIPAELNSYPGPRHVLDLAEQLELTATQSSKMKSIYDRMHTEAVRLGEEIIALETSLDAAFSSQKIDEAALEKLTGAIATRQGRLRYTHLEAHLAARAILTAPQIKAYNEARGY